tara:strand:- start:350 stop:574 length:225 start_codon:yes stop_codon:yes gene_type:complete
MTTEENLTLQELVYAIQNAAEELEVKTKMTFEEIVSAFHDSDGFLAGHILGMRDCLTIVATLYGIEMTDKEEEE